MTWECICGWSVIKLSLVVDIVDKNNYLFAFTLFNSLSVNPTKWSITLKQFVAKSRRIVWVCLTILCGWRLKG